MDGVLVDSEKAWFEYENDFLDRFLGKEISTQIGDTIGMSVRTVYEKATELGFKMSREEFQRLYDLTAFSVYDRAHITPNVNRLGNYLIDNGYKLGLVSSSATSWIEKVLPRISFGQKFESIISINERLDLKPKPDPDGYLETMRALGSGKSSTIILEDSNSGIAAGKASGAFTIGFQGNLVDGYKQTGGDAYAKTVDDILQIVKKLRL